MNLHKWLQNLRGHKPSWTKPGRVLSEMKSLTQENKGSNQETYGPDRTERHPWTQKAPPQTLPWPMSLICSSTKALEAELRVQNLHSLPLMIWLLFKWCKDNLWLTIYYKHSNNQLTSLRYLNLVLLKSS